MDSSKKGVRYRRIAILAAFMLILLAAYLFLSRDSGLRGIDAATNEQRLAFIASYGWQVGQQPEQETQVTIPAQFGDVYNSYNALQLTQGFDLRPLQGKSCTQYRYRVTNYPDTTQQVYIGLLVYEGKIAGAEIYSAQVDGFMLALYHSGEECPVSSVPLQESSSIPEDAPTFAYTEPAQAGIYPTD